MSGNQKLRFYSTVCKQTQMLSRLISSVNSAKSSIVIMSSVNILSFVAMVDSGTSIEYDQKNKRLNCDQEGPS